MGRRAPTGVAVPLQVPVGVLDDHDRRVHHGADGDGDAAERHDVGPDALHVHHDESDQHREREGDHRDQRGAQVQQEDDAHERHDRHLLEQLLAEGGDRVLDQDRPVIDRHHLHPRGQPGLEFVEPRLDPSDDLVDVHARAHDDDAADHLSLAVQLGEAPADLRPELDGGDVLDGDRGAGGIHPERDAAHVVETPDVALPAHHELGLRGLEDAPADVRVAAPHGVPDAGERDVVGAQPVGVHGDLVLPDEPADARHLRDTLDGGELVLEEPVLDRPQFGEIVVVGAERVHVGPADAARVGTEGGADALGQPAADVVQVLEDPAPRPVEVGAVLEDHIDEREPEERVAPHHRGRGDREHLGGDRVGHLVLDHLRGLSRVVGEHDHLDVGEVRERVERDGAERLEPGDGEERRQHEHEQAVPERPLDEARQHEMVLRRSAVPGAGPVPLGGDAPVLPVGGRRRGGVWGGVSPPHGKRWRESRSDSRHRPVGEAPRIGGFRRIRRTTESAGEGAGGGMRGVSSTGR